MKLYVNGAKVGVNHDQKGPVLSLVAPQCCTLHLGGAATPEVGGLYRGAVDEVRLWRTARTHSDVLTRMYTKPSPEDQLDLVMVEHFDTDLERWLENQDDVDNAVMPKLVGSDIHEGLREAPEVKPSQCGHTVCDDPAVITSYTGSWQMRLPKQVRLRVFNLLHDNGTGPQVTEQQLAAQEGALRRAYKPHNITWQWNVQEVRNTTLRSKTILVGCEPASVGNGRCNPECNHKGAGFDGGDCDTEILDCHEDRLGDGHCDLECNIHFFFWDDGDCCQQMWDYCLQPSSPNRWAVWIGD